MTDGCITNVLSVPQIMVRGLYRQVLELLHVTDATGTAAVRLNACWGGTGYKRSRMRQPRWVRV